MNTRKYPRTLEQAFGPYTGQEIEDDQAPQSRTFVAVCALCVAIVVAAAAVFVVKALA